MKRVALILTIAALTGCQTLSPADQMAQDRATCEYFGAPFGSEGHFSCMMAQQQRRDVQQAEFNASMNDMARTISRSGW